MLVHQWVPHFVAILIGDDDDHDSKTTIIIYLLGMIKYWLFIFYHDPKTTKNHRDSGAKKTPRDATGR